jgi:putative ABC transport system substrate-binding protein
VKRREFLALFGSAAVTRPCAVRAQSGVPTIGFLTSRTPKEAEYLIAALREGLKEAGYVEGQNVAIEYRYAESHNDRLPALAADLVGRQVAVLVAGGTSGPAIAATKTIPSCSRTGYDPVASGLVASLNRPGGNVTGATFYSGALGGKQVEYLTEVAPKTAVFGLLVNPNSAGAASQMRDTQSAAQRIGRKFQTFSASSESDVDSAFAALAKLPNSAMLISVDPFFDSHPALLIQAAARYKLPAAYYLRDFVRAGGLLSYGASITDTYRQAGNYAGRILKGEKPGDLPIQLPTKFELTINLKTAKDLRLAIPSSLAATAEEVIE